jgi:hypothetical protein
MVADLRERFDIIPVKGSSDFIQSAFIGGQKCSTAVYALPTRVHEQQ